MSETSEDRMFEGLKRNLKKTTEYLFITEYALREIMARHELDYDLSKDEILIRQLEKKTGYPADLIREVMAYVTPQTRKEESNDSKDNPENSTGPES